MRKALISAASLVALGAITASPASAIECEGNFQVQRNGNLISTPFCRDGYLADVANEYGMEVSARAIRYNPHVKRDTCRLVGYDIRVKDTCADYLPENQRNNWY